ncbi:MAG: bifunctional molybdenum cofactor biosynthesis protein MoaC/MoaB [Bdellovibrio sp.]|nr:bifunctional molybdenum cofactor biosynthesis protein MoaC/MoaB [Bdellovibrio sp.]
METTTHSHPWGDRNSFRMIDVGAKAATHRRAVAEGSIILAEDAFNALRDKKNPKGDVLSLAEVAGIMAAKRTADSIPLCHPLPLDYVRLSFTLHEETKSLTVFCEAGTTAKTGVEMEALAGVNGALLTIYDLSKAVNPAITILNMRLNFKEGGKSGIWKHPDYQMTAGASESLAPSKSSAVNLSLANLSVAVITISDKIADGTLEDLSGPLLCDQLANQGASVKRHDVVTNNKKNIQSAILDLIRDQKVDVVFTTGGTGLSLHDVTPEAIEEICSRKIEGFGELLRQSGAKQTPTSYLSRSLACVIDHSIVVALPGHPNAVVDGVHVLAPLLGHSINILRGGTHAEI